MGKKYFVWSFDDGLEQDKKIIEILRDYRMGATFNLNSGLYGKKQVISRLGTMGMHAIPAEEYHRKRWHLLPHVPHERIPADEVREVYRGFEVASHTVGHERLTDLPEEEMRRCIGQDVESLSQTFGTSVTGFAYPYGAYNETVKNALRRSGITYARTVRTSGRFDFPADPLAMDITAWHIQPDVFEKLDAFLDAPPAGQDQLFLLFAHGYEFDFGVKESSWEKFRRICDRVAGHDEVICCSAREALSQHMGGRKDLKD